MLNFQVKRLATIACFFLTIASVVSCSKSVDKKISTSMIDITPTTITETKTTTTTTPTTTAPLYSKTVNFDNRVDGAYGYTLANQDFTNVSFWGDQSRSIISGGKLKTVLKSNLLGGDGGNISRVDVPDAAEYQLNFDMMFDQNFDFSWGGKVGFGFLIGNGYTGGVPGWDGNGGSLRLMWYKNTSTSPVILKPYVYYKDQPGTYGNDFGKAFPATGSISKGVWYNVKMYAKANTGSNTDGRVQMVINGVTVLDQAIRWTTNDINRMIKHVSFETFRGGAETYWQSSSDGNIYFDNVSYTAIK